jgi:ribosomal protein S18 acetylase RimI-like enzyme
MNCRIVPVTQLTEHQILELALLHQAIMHSLLSELGLPVVERYYQFAAKDSTVLGFCALSESGQLLGWAIGSPRPDQLNGRLREAPLWFISQMTHVLITRPRLMGQLWAAMRTVSAPIPAGGIELTYLGVEHSARKQGVGREILQAFLRAARDAKYHLVVLSMEVENLDAIALYTRAGFAITGTFTEGSFHRHRMELTL